MSKQKYVVFKPEGGARIFINPADPDELKALGQIVLDPDLSDVKGVPPEHWALEDGKVVERLPVEQSVEEMTYNAKVMLLRRLERQRRFRVLSVIILISLLAAILMHAYT